MQESHPCRVLRFFSEDPNELDFTIPVGGDHFDAYGDFSEVLDDFDLSETETRDPDDEDDYMSYVWGGMTAAAAAGAMAMGSSIPFLIGETETTTDVATDVADAAFGETMRETVLFPGADQGAGAAAQNAAVPNAAVPQQPATATTAQAPPPQQPPPTQ